MTIKKVLVVAGDYDLVQGVRKGLDTSGCAVYAAHSHRDALYIIDHEPFDLVVVDALMTDRISGDVTLKSITELAKRPPILIYKSVANGVLYTEPVVQSLQPDKLREAVLRTLPQDQDARVQVKQPRISPMVTDLFWRDEEIQTLFSLSRSLTEVLDLSEVLNRVVEAARRLTNAEEGLILLPETDSDQLYLRAKVGIDSEVAANFRVKTHDTIAGTVFSSGQSMLLGEAGPQKVKTQYFVNSLLYVPIIHKGKTLGVLGVNNKTKHDVFNQRHKDLLTNLSSYAAIAIENARIYAQSVRRARELKALVDASQAINASLSPEHVIPAICEQFAHVLNVSYAEIFQRVDDNTRLVSVARHYQAKWRAGTEPVVALAERPALRTAIENRRHVMMARARHDVPNEIGALDRVGANAMLCIPVTTSEQTPAAVQAFYLIAPETAPSTDIIQRIQRMFLEYRSVAEEGATAHFVKLLNDVRTLVKADWVDYAVLTTDRRMLQTQFAAGSAVWLDDPRPQIDLTSHPDLNEFLDSRAAINCHADEETMSLGAASLIKYSRARSILALPLIERGQPWGMVVFADTEHAHRFSPRETDLARATVAQAATALANSHLVTDLEASLRDLKEAQNRLVQSARLTAMGELAAAVAHQINNPLTTIVLDTELLLLKEAPGSKNAEILNAISRAGKRAAGVVRRLLASARPNTSTTPPQPINVVQTVEEILTLVHSYLNRSSITLVRKLPDEALPPVVAVPGELDDVWLNLILNAHDALTGRPEPKIGIEITCPPEADMMEVKVWDNGPGIPTEIVTEIFKPFFTTKPAGEGTGLGLHICRQVVDRVGGTINVESQPEQGTTFTIRLPVTRSGVL
ncbi:MAG: GAF domain-containing protein [Chloroflexi bacterium]|nr:GAF domain-containing protein [Chloroflexota bacterium]